MCNWENVLRKSTMQLEVLRTRERAWLAQATKEERKHHAVSGSTTRALNAVRAEMAKLRTQAGI